MKDQQFYQADAIRRCILLDSCSSMMIWSNPDMVSNIRETNKTLNLSTNAGVLSTNKKAYLPRELWKVTQKTFIHVILAGNSFLEMIFSWKNCEK